MKTLTIVRKAIALMLMFVGMAAVSALDSNVSVLGELGLVAVFLVGFFGGGALFFRGETMEE